MGWHYSRWDLTLLPYANKPTTAGAGGDGLPTMDHGFLTFHIKHIYTYPTMCFELLLLAFEIFIHSHQCSEVL